MRVIMGLWACLAACGGAWAADHAPGSGGNTAGASDGAPGLLAIEDLRYAGAFRVGGENLGDSDVNYAVGTLGYNPKNHSLFIAGHAQQTAIAEYPILAPGLGTDVRSLPLASTPLQRFKNLLDSGPANPDGLNRITGMLWVDGKLIVNAENWYDAGGTARDTTLLIRDADHIDGAVDRYYELQGRARAAGFMGGVPGEWQARLGGTHYVGWASNYSIIGRYSVGPSLYLFDPATITGTPGSISTRVLMEFPHGEGTMLGADALGVRQGSASPLWNLLSRAVYGFIVPGTRTYAVFGSSGGVDSGIGYKITQDDGNLCGGYCAYRAADGYNYYWFFDLDAILSASTPYAPRPYAYGRWSLPFDNGGRHKIIGGAFDPGSGTLYLTLGRAGQIGEYDRPPLILTFDVPVSKPSLSIGNATVNEDGIATFTVTLTDPPAPAPRPSE